MKVIRKARHAVAYLVPSPIGWERVPEGLVRVPGLMAAPDGDNILPNCKGSPVFLCALPWRRSALKNQRSVSACPSSGRQLFCRKRELHPDLAECHPCPCRVIARPHNHIDNTRQATFCYWLVPKSATRSPAPDLSRRVKTIVALSGNTAWEVANSAKNDWPFVGFAVTVCILTARDSNS
jgi:hypothetical protein